MGQLYGLPGAWAVPSTEGHVSWMSWLRNGMRASRAGFRWVTHWSTRPPALADPVVGYCRLRATELLESPWLDSTTGRVRLFRRWPTNAIAG
eukprot:s1179_g22.t1